ncbi:MAG: Lrp/AsnC family transcriptional regulator [Planctomycetaceae bacterium]
MHVYLDRIDHGILAALQADGRMSNKDVAARCGISPSTCLERVRRLRSLGVIRGFHADVDPQALGIGVQAMIAVRLNHHANVSFDKLCDELIQVPEVLAVYLLAGAQDALVHVAVRDVSHLRDLLADSFTARGDVLRVETHLIFEHARKSALPEYDDEE